MLIGRTVLWEVARNFLATLTATTGIAFFMLSITFLKRTPGVGMGFLVQVFPLFFPLALQFTVPLAVLTSVILTFSRMQSDGELTALSASGVSPLLLIRPVLAGAAAVALVALLLTDTLAPFAAARLRSAKRDLFHQLQTSFRSGLSDLDLGAGRISFEGFSGDNFHDICLEWERDQELHLYRARRGSISISEDEQVTLTLHNARGVFPYETRRGEWEVESRTVTVAASLAEITGTGDTNRNRKDLESWELAYAGGRALGREYGARFTSDGAREELARRSALAASAFFFALIGIPLGIRSARGGRVGAFLMALAPVLLVYFPLVIGASGLARAGELPAYPALWAGNVVVGVAGVWLLSGIVRR